VFKVTNVNTISSKLRLILIHNANGNAAADREPHEPPLAKQFSVQLHIAPRCLTKKKEFPSGQSEKGGRLLVHQSRYQDQYNKMCHEALGSHPSKLHHHKDHRLEARYLESLLRM
jgi:hypothetical protein